MFYRFFVDNFFLFFMLVYCFFILSLYRICAERYLMRMCA